MTLERKELLVNIMAWYWSYGHKDNLISLSDFEFVYDIWKHGLSFYGSDVKERLNRIRNIYSQHKEKYDAVHAWADQLL